MTTRTNDDLLDAIVAGVLDRLRGSTAPTDPTANGGRQPSESRPENLSNARVANAPRSSEPLFLPDRVITEAVLEAKLNGANIVQFVPKVVLTPTARDFLRVNKIAWSYTRPSANSPKRNDAGAWAALIVHAAPTVERVVADLLPESRRELLGCPDDAAKLAIAEIARGGFSQAVIFAEQTHRAACFANRHESVKAVAVADAADVAAVRKQLRANVWCIDPTNRGYFELRNLVKAVS